jgi:hypothetical protein
VIFQGLNLCLTNVIIITKRIYKWLQAMCVLVPSNFLWSSRVMDKGQNRLQVKVNSTISLKRLVNFKGLFFFFFEIIDEVT